MERTKGVDVGEMIRADLDAINESGKGICRQLATKLAFELETARIPSRIILMKGDSGRPHVSVLYELDHHLFVADLTKDVGFNKGGKPVFDALPVQLYMNVMKKSDHISWFQVIDAPVTQIRNNDDY